MSKRKTVETVEQTEEQKVQKVSRKVIMPFVAKFSEPLKAMDSIIQEMPESGAKKSFGLTVETLKKKYNKFASSAVVIVQGETLTEDEKQALAEYRRSKNV